MRTFWKWFLKWVVVGVIASLTFRGADWLVRQSASLPAVPQPNGYEELLTVSRAVEKPRRDLMELSDSEIRSLAESNRACLHHVRQALRMECRVPLQTGRGWIAQHEADLKKVKVIGLLFAIESKALSLDGRTNEAAYCQVEIVRLGHALSRGGGRVDALNGLLLETVGVASLQTLLPKASAEWCRQAARDLHELESKREGQDQVAQNEKAWSTRAFGLVGRVGDFVLSRAKKRQDAELRQRWSEASRRARRLVIRLAARAYESDTGRRAMRTAELVPQYLTAVPADPETRAPMDEVPAVPAH
jgi:hypothetical protein